MEEFEAKEQAAQAIREQMDGASEEDMAALELTLQDMEREEEKFRRDMEQQEEEQGRAEADAARREQENAMDTEMDAATW